MTANVLVTWITSSAERKVTVLVEVTFCDVFKKALTGFDEVGQCAKVRTETLEKK
jgi:hypothetical protein